MYSSFPKRDRLAIQVALAAAWFFSAIAGVGGVLLTPVTVQNEVGLHLPIISSGLVFASSAFALYGIITNKYQWEWVGAWFASSGSFVYISTVWYLVIFAGNDTRLQQAASLSSLLCFYIYRIVSCSAHARKQRTIHELVLRGKVAEENA